MKIPLSRRLRECTAFIHPGDRVADVGCDHGYLGISLLKKGIASRVLAADINEGPLQTAMQNAQKFGVADKMQFFLSDGLKNVSREFDTLVCAGMGGLTMMSILDNAPWLRSSGYRLVLQCQAKTPQLRRYLSEHGWTIAREILIQDGKFLYTVLEAVYKAPAPLTPGQCCLSPALLREHQPELREYYRRITKGLREAVEGRGREAVPFKAQAFDELSRDPAYEWLREDRA